MNRSLGAAVCRTLQRSEAKNDGRSKELSDRPIGGRAAFSLGRHTIVSFRHDHGKARSNQLSFVECLNKMFVNMQYMSETRVLTEKCKQRTF